MLGEHRMSLHLSEIFTDMSLYNSLSYIVHRYIRGIRASLPERECTQLVCVSVLSIPNMFVVVLSNRLHVYLIDEHYLFGLALTVCIYLVLTNFPNGQGVKVFQFI